MIAERGPVMERAAARLIELSEDEHTRHRLESYRRFEMDQRVNLRAARAEGMEKGREEGRAEGMERAAMAMKSEGMDVNIISRITGLSVNDILSL